MRALALAAVIAFASSPVLAAPFCHMPRGGGPVIVFEFEIGDLGETDRAMFYEMRLRAMGINASNTRFWSECIQTFVRENGKETMRFYDPWTLEEIPVD
jgi:hypothetical protein